MNKYVTFISDDLFLKEVKKVFTSLCFMFRVSRLEYLNLLKKIIHLKKCEV